MLWLPCRNDRAMREAHRPSTIADPIDTLWSEPSLVGYAQFASLPSANAYASASRIVCRHAFGISVPFRFSTRDNDGNFVDLAEWHIRLGLNQATGQCHKLVVKKHIGNGPVFVNNDVVQQNGLAGNDAFGWGSTANNWIDIRILEDDNEIASGKIAAVNQSFPASRPGFLQTGFLTSNVLSGNMRRGTPWNRPTFPALTHNVLSGHFHLYSMWGDDYTEPNSRQFGPPDPSNGRQPYGRIAFGYMVDNSGALSVYAHVGDGAQVFGAGCKSLCVPVNRKPEHYRADVFCKDLSGNDVENGVFFRSETIPGQPAKQAKNYASIFGAFVQQDILRHTAPLKPDPPQLFGSRKPALGWSNHRAANQIAWRHYDSPIGILDGSDDPDSGRFLDHGSTVEWQSGSRGRITPRPRDITAPTVPIAFAPGHPDGTVAFVPVNGASSNVHWNDEVNDLLSVIRVKLAFSQPAFPPWGYYSGWFTLSPCGGMNEYNGTGTYAFWARSISGVIGTSTTTNASMFVGIYRQDVLDLPANAEDELTPKDFLVVKGAIYGQFPAIPLSELPPGGFDPLRDVTQSMSWAAVLAGQELESFLSGNEVMPAVFWSYFGLNEVFRPVIQAIG